MRPVSQRPIPGIFAASCERPPVGIWTFAESAGTVAPDQSGLGHHAVLIGGVKRAAASDGPALEFDGVTQYATVAHSTALMPKRITIALKTRNLSGPAEFDVILMKCADSTWSDGYGLFYSSPSTVVKFFAGHYSSGGIAQVTLTPSNENTLVATYDGGAARLFVNGTEGTPGSYSGGITANTGPLEFGRGRSDSYNIHGRLHWVQIYDYALPPESARLLSAGVNPWTGLYPPGPLRVRPASLPGLILASTAAGGDGVSLSGLADGIVRAGLSDGARKATGIG